ncbi:MAG: hypothetical protein NVSMB18_09570 [Acetobacteraceae bacterium]
MSWMTSRRLDWMLRIRGTDLAAWPEPERQAAFGLLRRSRVARRVLADAMAGEAAPEPDVAALCRIQVAMCRVLAPRPALVRGLRWSALAACAAAGLCLGLTTREADPPPGLFAADLFGAAPTIAFAALDP